MVIYNGVIVQVVSCIVFPLHFTLAIVTFVLFYLFQSFVYIMLSVLWCVMLALYFSSTTHNLHMYSLIVLMFR